MFHDLNGNGIFNAGVDKPIAKVRVALLGNTKKRAAPVVYSFSNTDANGNVVFRLKNFLAPFQPLIITRAFDFNTILSELTANGQGSFGATTKIPIALPVPWPTISSISPDTGLSKNDGITSATELTVLGTGLPGATVKVFIDGQAAGTATIDSYGKWSVKTAKLASGNFSITATVNDGGQPGQVCAMQAI